jgi:hypothetical protein
MCEEADFGLSVQLTLPKNKKECLMNTGSQRELLAVEWPESIVVF